MEYRETRSLGDVGERRISDAFHSEAPSLGYKMLDGVLLDAADDAALFDHVIIDRHGILVVEAKSGDAAIRGGSADRIWTATFHNGGRERLLNPLQENEHNRQVLHRVLGAGGRRLGQEYVQSVVVFANSDTRNLKLTELDQMRVVSLREIGDFMRARYDFAPNPGELSAEDVACMVSFLKNADRSTIIDVRHKHADAVSRALRPYPFNLLPALTLPTKRGRAAAVTRNVFSGVDRYVGVSEATPPRRRALGPAGLLAIVALVAALAWLSVGGGAPTLFGVAGGNPLGPLLARFQPPAKAITPPQQVSPPVVPMPAIVDAPDLPTALRRLRSASPKAWAALPEPNNPVVTVQDGLTKYTWASVERSTPGSVRVRQVSVTLDAEGGLIGVDAGR